jgi:hypothetical protein
MSADQDDYATALRLSRELNPGFWGEDRSDTDYAYALDVELNEPHPAPDSDYALALSMSSMASDHSAAAEEEEEEDGDTLIARAMQHNEDNDRTHEALSTPFHSVDGSFCADNTVIIEGVLHREQECGSAYGVHTNFCGWMAFCNGNGAEADALKNRVAPAANAIRQRLRPTVPVQFDGPSTMADTEVWMALAKGTHTSICIANRSAGSIVVYTDGGAARPIVKLHLRGGHFTRLLPG